nr:hypothetical protein [Deltaproteobacteria bacterium]
LTAGFANGILNYSVSNPGEQIIQWDKKNGKPVVENSNEKEIEIIEKENSYQIKVQTNIENDTISIRKSKN